MAKIISLFNHKGGVSKTTTTFNLGWMLATKGKRVVIADFDPQCNLTGMVMGFKGSEDLDNFYQTNPPNNVRDGLAPAFESQPRQISHVECQQIDGNPNLYLLPGHIGLSEYETSLGIAQELSGSMRALRNLPGSIRYLLNATADNVQADIVLVDMSPSLGPLNQNLLSTSDYFLVPLHPDYFSTMALNSLAATLPKWKLWAEEAYGQDVLKTADYPFPEPSVKFIGAVIQKYRPRNGGASRAFRKWIDDLEKGLENTLIPKLLEVGMIDIEEFVAKSGQPPWKAILEMADFNSLIAFSQDHQVPVYEITQEQAEQAGAVWTRSENSMEAFRNAFSNCADKIINLIA